MKQDRKVSFAGEGNMRAVAKTWTKEDLVTENAPFVFLDKDKRQYIGKAPLCYVKDLESRIQYHLNSLEQ